MQTKVRDAVKAAGRKGLDIGGILSVTHTHQEPSEAGPMMKVYEVSYTPAQAAAANQALGVQQPAPVQQPQAQVPGIDQMLGQQAAPAAQPAAAAPAVPDLSSLTPEAQAMVAKMLAAQQPA
jgi:hypothetical protein